MEKINQHNIENKHIEMWKIKRIIKKLDSSKG